MRNYQSHLATQRSVKMIDHDIATDEEIIKYCSNENEKREVLYQVRGGGRVIKLSEKAIVKIGYGISMQELENQQRARQLIDPEVVKIPEVYRFIQHGDIGYIIMEYVSGVAAETVDRALRDERILTILDHFAHVTDNIAGPLAGGVATGRLWSEYEKFVPTSINDITKYINRRLRIRKRRTSFKGKQLVLVHADLKDDNLAWQNDGRAHLLDWESAGFYPRIFEYCALRLINDKSAQHIADIFPLTEDDKALADDVFCAWNLEQNYYL